METPEQELELSGLTAYRDGDLERCIEALRKVTESCPTKWNARLYLAMAYSRTGRVGNAMQEFTDISSYCGDADVKQKAFEGLKAMKSMSLSKMQALSKVERR